MIRVNTPGLVGILSAVLLLTLGGDVSAQSRVFNTQAQVETIGACPFIRVQVSRSRVEDIGIDPVTTTSVQYLITDCRDGTDGEIVAHARQMIDDAAYAVNPQTGAHTLSLDLPIAINVRWHPNAEWKNSHQILRNQESGTTVTTTIEVQETISADGDGFIMGRVIPIGASWGSVTSATTTQTVERRR